MAKKPTQEQIKKYLEVFEKINTDFEKMSLDEVQALLEQKEEFEYKYDTECKIFEQDDKVGLKDFTGKVVIPAEYDDVWSCNYDLLGSFNLAVKKDGKYAIISSDGSAKLLTDFIYDGLEFDGDKFVCEQNGKFGLIDDQGGVLIPSEMDGIESLSDELVTFEKEGKVGFLYIDVAEDETKTIDPVFDSYEAENNLVITVTKDGQKGFVDKDGNFTTDENNAWLKILQNPEEAFFID